MQVLLCVLVLASIVAGCTSPAADDAAKRTLTSGAPPADHQRLYMDSTAEDLPILTPRLPTNETMGGPAGDGYVFITDGPYEAIVPSAAFPSGTLVQFRLSYACFHPAQVSFRFVLQANGTDVAQASQQETFIGTFVPPIGDATIDVGATLSKAVPEGAWLSLTITSEGCAAIATGNGGKWAGSVLLGRDPDILAT